MNVAVNGERTSLLTRQLRSGAFLFAVAQGFGVIDGEPAPRRALVRIAEELERAARYDYLRRTAGNPRREAALLRCAVDAANAYVHGRSASHDDYVTAACSFTAILLVETRAYVAHAGSTSAYVARAGALASLTRNTTFEDSSAVPVVLDALGLTNVLRLPVKALTIADGDALILCAPPDRLLVIRHRAQRCDEPARRRLDASHLLRMVYAAAGFCTLLCLR